METAYITIYRPATASLNFYWLELTSDAKIESSCSKSFSGASNSTILPLSRVIILLESMIVETRCCTKGKKKYNGSHKGANCNKILQANIFLLLRAALIPPRPLPLPCRLLCPYAHTNREVHRSSINFYDTCFIQTEHKNRSDLYVKKSGIEGIISHKNSQTMKLTAIVMTVRSAKAVLTIFCTMSSCHKRRTKPEQKLKLQQ